MSNQNFQNQSSCFPQTKDPSIYRLSFLNLTDSNWPFASPPSRGRSRFKDSNYPLSPSLLLSEFTFRMRRHKQTFFEVNKSFLPNLRDEGEREISQVGVRSRSCCARFVEIADRGNKGMNENTLKEYFC